MKNKGFTLMELLGVVIILGILTLITFPNIMNQIRKTQTGINNATESLIIDAAKDYYKDNINNYEKTEGITYCINIQELTNNGYLNQKLKDKDLNDIDNTKKVKLMYNNNNYNYEITDSCTYGITRNNVEVPIVSEGSGLYESTIESGRLIYRGGDTINNWIELNEGTEEEPYNVLYRIMSFESDGTIKVIRNESIGEYAWDIANTRDASTNTYCSYSRGCDAWGNQANTYYNDKSLSELVQDFYYFYYPDNQTNTFSIMSNGKNGSVVTDSSLNTYLNDTWINTVDFKNLIDTHLFNVGGVYYTDSYTGGDKGLLKEQQEEKSLAWKGKIGLFNITEFVETSLSENCISVWSNFFSNPDNSNANYSTGQWPCAKQNWIYIKETEWPLSPYSSYHKNMWCVMSSGEFSVNSVESSRSVRPAFYLKSSVVLGGAGTETNPYYIRGV